jgi:hypothetical protein
LQNVAVCLLMVQEIFQTIGPLKGLVDLDEQARWYREMFQQTRYVPWISGWGLWDWPAYLCPDSQAISDQGYQFYGKPAENVIRAAYLNG